MQHQQHPVAAASAHQHMNGQMVLPQTVVAQLIQAGLANGQEIRIEGLPPEVIGPVALALQNLRQRRPPGGGVGGQQQPGAGNQLRMGEFNVHAARPPRRFRIININLNLSIRTVLQILVFAMVLYQVQH